MPSITHTYIDDANIQHRQEQGLMSVKLARNRAYALVVLLLLVIISQAIALTALMPLKTVVPALVTVDTASGHVVKVAVINPEELTAQKSVMLNELHDYVVMRHTLDPDDRQRLSDLVRIHSTQAVASEYDAELAPENPNNPYFSLASGARRFVEVTSVNLLNQNTGQVQFRTRTGRPGAETKIEYYTAIVRFEFTGAPRAIGDRWENPLGFAVTAYRADQQLSHGGTTP